MSNRRSTLAPPAKDSPISDILSFYALGLHTVHLQGVTLPTIPLHRALDDRQLDALAQSFQKRINRENELHAVVMGPVQNSWNNIIKGPIVLTLIIGRHRCYAIQEALKKGWIPEEDAWWNINLYKEGAWHSCSSSMQPDQQQTF